MKSRERRSRLFVVLVTALGCSDADDGSSTIDTESTEPAPSSTSTTPPSSTPPPTAPPEDADAAPAPQPPPSIIYLQGCFTYEDGFDTCNQYCASRGQTCLERSCNVDGALLEGAGYTWVSWPMTELADCESIGYPDQMSFDACTTPVWLQPTKARDDVVRCCCR